MPTTAADLPPELFPFILNYLSSDASGRRTYARQPALAICSLVCHYWARCCRPILFSNLTHLSLRSKEDLNSFILFHRRQSRLPHVIDLVKGLEVVQDCHSPPWFHHLCRIQPELKRLDFGDVRLHLHDGTSRTPDTPSSLSPTPWWSLPRSPSLCGLGYTELEMTNIHLRSLSEVSKLIRGARTLTLVSLHDVTWADENQASTPSKLFTRYTQPGLTVSATGCTDDAALALLTFSDLLFSRHRAARYGPVIQHDSTVACEMLGQLLKGSHDLHISSAKSISPRLHILDAFGLWLLDPQYPVVNVNLKFRIYGSYIPAPQDPLPVTVYTIFVEIEVYANDAEKPDWSCFIPSIKKFRNLHTVVFLSKSRDSGDLALVMRDIMEGGEPIPAQVNFRYAHLAPQESTDSELLEVQRDNFEVVGTHWAKHLPDVRLLKSLLEKKWRTHEAFLNDLLPTWTLPIRKRATTKDPECRIC